MSPSAALSCANVHGVACRAFRRSRPSLSPPSGCDPACQTSPVSARHALCLLTLAALPGTRAPARGAPSAAQAAEDVICAQEHVFGSSSSLLGLVDNVRVQVGAGRPYIHVRDSFQDIDPHQLVYPIRGSFRSDACSELVGPNGSPERRGRNCSVRENPNASGVCFTTTFGDWRCDVQNNAVPLNTDTRSPANNAAPPVP